MSSLRLALKQSLEENPQIAHRRSKPSAKDRRKKKKKGSKSSDLEHHLGRHATITVRDEGVGSSGLSSSSGSSTSDSSSSSDSDSNSSTSSSSSSSSSSSGSSSSSDDADREAKELFDADLSSDDDDDDDENDNNSNLNNNNNNNKKERLKINKNHDDAAHTIQNHWKAKKNQFSHAQQPHDQEYKRNEAAAQNDRASEEWGANAKNGPNKTVEPPRPEVLEWIRNMSEKRQRRNIAEGLRVKVRFVKKGNVNGRITRKLKWYGGVVASTSHSGRRIRIKYDDGTDEVADFPDKDIIVDDESNGRHRGGVGRAFVPPSLSNALENDGQDDLKDTPSPKKRVLEKGGSGDDDDDNDDDEEGRDSSCGTRDEKLSSNERNTYRNRGDYGDEDSDNDDDYHSDHAATKEKAPQSNIGHKKLKSTHQCMDSKVNKDNINNDDCQLGDEPQVRPHTTGKSSLSNEEPQNLHHVDTAENKTNAAEDKFDVITDNCEASTEQKLSKDGRSNTSDVMSKQKIPSQQTDSKDTEELPLKTNPIPRMSPIAEKKSIFLPPKGIYDTLPLPLSDGAEKAGNASSSSGSTCSSTSCQGGVKQTSPAIEDKATPNAQVQLLVGGERRDLKSDAVVLEAGDNTIKKTDHAERKTSHVFAPTPAVSVKKHRPLAIKITLPKRKRPEDEAKSTDRLGPDSNTTEPARKKTKHPEDEESDRTHSKSAGATARVPIAAANDKPKQVAIEGTAKENQQKASNMYRPSHDDESSSDEEMQEDDRAEVKTPIKPVASGHEPEHPPRKKPKLSIHISKEKIKAAENAVLPQPLSRHKEASLSIEPNAKDCVATSSLNVDEAPVEKASVGKCAAEKFPVEKQSYLKQDETINGNSPANSSHLPDDDDKQAYSLERSGKKSVKRAVEKFKGKKNKKKDRNADNTEKKAAEEDPWVQCDRCHKWRHLPATVNLDTLPEHWFCELNYFDEKRNHCDAPEQTPKDVVKEKKRLKLERKKLQMEQQAEAQNEVEDKDSNAGNNFSASPSDGERENELSLTRRRSSSPDPTNDDAKKNSSMEEDDAITTTTGGESPKLSVKPKGKRGRPRNDEKGKGKEEKADEDDKKQEWVQCEKCNKWRRLPPRIKAEDLPDVWFCSMNTWEINLATCTAIEDKLEPATKETFNVQSQIPVSSGSSGKLSYRSLIFGNGRRQKNVSERMRAQDSLFSTQHEDDADMSTPPTVMYASSDAFASNKALQKASSDGEDHRTSIFDVMIHSRAWAELNNNIALFEAKKEAAYNSVGFAKYCNHDGSLKNETIETLKTIVYFTFGTKVLAAHEVLLEIQCRHWKEVPRKWLELRSICTIEIVTYILKELVRDGLVQEMQDSNKLLLDNVFYRITPDPDQSDVQSAEQVIDLRSNCLKIRKPWRE